MTTGISNRHHTCREKIAMCCRSSQLWMARVISNSWCLLADNCCGRTDASQLTADVVNESGFYIQRLRPVRNKVLFCVVLHSCCIVKCNVLSIAVLHALVLYRKVECVSDIASYYNVMYCIAIVLFWLNHILYIVHIFYCTAVLVGANVQCVQPSVKWLHT